MAIFSEHSLKISDIKGIKVIVNISAYDNSLYLPKFMKLHDYPFGNEVNAALESDILGWTAETPLDETLRKWVDDNINHDFDWNIDIHVACSKYAAQIIVFDDDVRFITIWVSSISSPLLGLFSEKCQKTNTTDFKTFNT